MPKNHCSSTALSTELIHALIAAHYHIRMFRSAIFYAMSKFVYLLIKIIISLKR